jgi:glutamate racemase
MAKIGVFDSGIGGLAVLSAIKNKLPNEAVVYFGDTAHLPYGDKSQDLIKIYSEKITDYLINDEKCDAIVIACNTASAAAYEYLRDKFIGTVPIINVIDPIVESVVSDGGIKNIGIIGTAGTISSGIYQEKLNRRKPGALVKSLATPMLVPMIEEGFMLGEINKNIINKYLNDESLKNIDTLILACTHYPLIKNEINEFYNGRVLLVDSTTAAANKLADILEKENLLADTKTGDDVFYVSDLTDSFQNTAKSFFGGDIKLVKKNIF